MVISAASLSPPASGTRRSRYNAPYDELAQFDRAVAAPLQRVLPEFEPQPTPVRHSDRQTRARDFAREDKPVEHGRRLAARAGGEIVRHLLPSR
jgi:hypothetical protein